MSDQMPQTYLSQSGKILVGPVGLARLPLGKKSPGLSSASR